MIQRSMWKEGRKEKTEKERRGGGLRQGDRTKADGLERDMEGTSSLYSPTAGAHPIPLFARCPDHPTTYMCLHALHV
ncbi:hypothetical protein ACLOJK_028595 [Asimina triloba]